MAEKYHYASCLLRATTPAAPYVCFLIQPTPGSTRASAAARLSEQGAERLATGGAGGGIMLMDYECYTVSFTNTAVAETEGDTLAFEVAISPLPGNLETITVEWNATDGTTDGYSDYWGTTGSSGMLTFGVSSTAQTLYFAT